MAQVWCDGHAHHVSVRGGRLRFHDHSMSALEDELVLAALGSPVSGCAEVLIAWRRREGLRVPDYEGVIASALGRPARPVRVLPEPLRRARVMSLACTRPRRPGRISPELSWDEPTRVAHEAERAARRHAARALGLVFAIADTSIGVPRCAVTPSDAGPILDLQVPLDWGVSVWVPGLETYGEAFVLAAGEDWLLTADLRTGELDVLPTP